MTKDWNVIFLAGMLEIGWVVGLNHAYNVFTWVLTIIGIYASMHLLIIGSRRLPVGSTYAVFAGIGATGTVLVEILLFGVPVEPMKIFLIVLLMTGIVGLQLLTPKSQEKRGEV